MTQAKKIDDAKPAVALPPLSNIIFQALATCQAGFSQTAGKARRFLPEIGPLAGFSEPADPDSDALEQLAGGGPVVIFLDAPFQPRAGWKAVDGAPLVLMVWQGSGLPEEDSCAPILKLSVEDSADMLELTAMTKPGPFGPRTHELGSFLRGCRGCAGDRAARLPENRREAVSRGGRRVGTDPTAAGPCIGPDDRAVLGNAAGSGARTQ
jgi:hypothetical protein